MTRSPRGRSVIMTAAAALLAAQHHAEKPLAGAIREAIGKDDPPAPPPLVDDGSRVKIRPAEPGSVHEPAPGQFTCVGDIAYVRAAEYEQTIARIFSARAKKKYGDKY